MAQTAAFIEEPDLPQVIKSISHLFEVFKVKLVTPPFFIYQPSQDKKLGFKLDG
jgi:hypothetical protein